MAHIFLVDDEKEIRDLVSKYLIKDGYQVTTFMNGDNLISEINRLKPDLVILDIMLPGSDGLALCRIIRDKYELPIIFISARGDEVDRILGLELGADDYLAKPFSPRELMVRIKNILRRVNRDHAKVSSSVLDLGNLVIDESRRSVLASGAIINLTGKEWDTFLVMAQNPSMPLTRQQLLEKAWGYDFYGDERIVDDVIKRIRKKLKDAKATVTIETVWGYGYKIEA